MFAFFFLLLPIHTAISSGIFGFPKPRCAQLLFDTAERFRRKFPTSPLREIRFTNYDRETVDIFTHEFDSRYPATKTTTTSKDDMITTVTKNTSAAAAAGHLFEEED